jgi:hypothetical protein
MNKQIFGRDEGRNDTSGPKKGGFQLPTARVITRGVFR